jgi:hypothetical protein
MCSIKWSMKEYITKTHISNVLYAKCLIVLSTVKEFMLCVAFFVCGRGEKRVQGFGGKAQGKETTWKTKA